MTTFPLDVRRAAQQPRVSNFPAYGTSAGDEAIELAARAGLRLDPWQQLVLRHSLGERPDGQWSAFEVALIVSRQNGKGAILEARELAGLLLFGERLILHSAHEMKTSSEAFRRVRDLFTNVDDFRKRVAKVSLQRGDEGIELKNGARLRFVARSTGSGRGFSGDLVILDEAYAVTEAHMDALMPTMSARPNPQIWYTSSPPLDAVSGAQLFRVRRRGLDGGGRLAYFDFGVDGCLDNLDGIDLDNRDLWYAANPALGHRVAEEFVQAERETLSPAGFARERLGIWPPDLSEGFQVIPETDWAAAFDVESEIDGPLVLAVAVSIDRSRAAIAACGRRADGKPHVEITSTALRSDNRNGTGWVVSRLVQLAERQQPVAIVMDEFGPTGSLIPAAEEAGLDVTRMGTAAAARAYGMFYDAVSGADPDGRVLRHIGQPELTAAVAGAKRRPLGEGFAWDRKNTTVDITPLVAATNALYGFATRPQDDQFEPFGFWA